MACVPTIEEKSSVCRVRKTSGTYRFTVQGFSGLSTKVGESIESPEFTLCGHEWQLRIFPGGSLESHKSFISYYLASKSNRVARASYKLSILSQVLGSPDEVFVSSGVRTFEAKGVQVDGWGRDKFVSATILSDSDYGYSLDDTVIFRVDITVVGELESASFPPVSTFHTTESFFTLQGCMKELLLDGKEYSDIILRVQDTEFFVHRCILCARSPVFQAMLGSSMQEAFTGVIAICDIEVDVMKEMLLYIYTDECSDISIFDEMADSLLIAASKYQIDGLVRIAEDYLSLQITADNAVNILLLADTYGACRLKESTLLYMSQNHARVLQTKEFQQLEGDLLKDTLAILNMAMKRKGCGSAVDSKEKHLQNSCTIQ